MASKIGKLPVAIPAGVTVTVAPKQTNAILTTLATAVNTFSVTFFISLLTFFLMFCKNSKTYTRAEKII